MGGAEGRGVQEGGAPVRYLPALVELGDGLLHLPEGAQRLQLPQLHLLDFLLQGGHVVLVGQAAAPLQTGHNVIKGKFHMEWDIFRLFSEFIMLLTGR